jgi:hypothetical protein
MPLFSRDYKEIGSTFLRQYLILGSFRQVAAWCKKQGITSAHKSNPWYTHQSIKNIIWKYAAFYPEDSYKVVCEYFDNKPLMTAPSFDDWFGFICWYAMDSLASKQYRLFVAKYPQSISILEQFKNGERELVKIG